MDIEPHANEQEARHRAEDYAKKKAADAAQMEYAMSQIPPFSCPGDDQIDPMALVKREQERITTARAEVAKLTPPRIELECEGAPEGFRERANEALNEAYDRLAAGSSTPLLDQLAGRTVGKLPELAAPYDGATVIPLPEGYAKFAREAGIPGDLGSAAELIAPEREPGQITEAAVAEIAELISANPNGELLDFAAIQTRMAELGLKAEDFMPPSDRAETERAMKAAAAEIHGAKPEQKPLRYLHVSVRVGRDEQGRPVRSAKGATAKLKDPDVFKVRNSKLSKRQMRKTRKRMAQQVRAIQADELKFIE